jgi:hypothetical protein
MTAFGKSDLNELAAKPQNLAACDVLDMFSDSGYAEHAFRSATPGSVI